MGFPPGSGYPNNDFGAQLQAYAQQIRNDLANDLRQQQNSFAGQFRQQAQAQLAKISQQVGELASIARALEVQRTGAADDPRVVRIEDIPGRRVPYDLLVEIPIGNNLTSERENSVTISQEGPFVAVKRVATFISQHQFRVTVDGIPADFAGRSFGRWRPIHSAWDLHDTPQDPMVDIGSWFTFLQGLGTPQQIATGAPGFVSSKSSFRTMEFDGRFFVQNAGSSFPRQNIRVPSSLWTTEINSPQELGALDFFERGEVITFRCEPSHANNPPFGNVDGNNLFGTPGWPFLEGQYDPHEGIITPGGLSIVDDALVNLPDDNVQRLPDGILVIGFIGYRIQQAIGPVP